ncbi:MAG: acetate/propionate family kinase [Planctomycetota bacterium]
MNVLVLNVGSTTLKYAQLDPVTGIRTAHGLVDRIGQAGGDAADHLSAATRVLDHLDLSATLAIGHRVVQGADEFTRPARVDSEVLTRLASLDTLAPLHNPPARAVIEFLHASEPTANRPALPQVLVFDTAYFASLPEAAYRYALDRRLADDHRIRRYGMHGTSHAWVLERALQAWPEITSEAAISAGDAPRIISLHLGGGASVSASVGGKAVATSMGMTPLEGLVMATRCGDLDPSVPLHLMRAANLNVDEVDRCLNKQSGLLGLCGDADMRRVLRRSAAEDGDAMLALEIYIRRLIQYIGGYIAILGGVDALLFTAGVGENSAEIRGRVVERLACFGIRLTESKNQRGLPAEQNCVDVAADGSDVRVLIVRTDEEHAIAKQTAECVGNVG